MRPATSKLAKFVLWFAQDNFATEIKQFRKAEMESIIKLFNVPIRIWSDQSETKPFWIVEASTEDIKAIASRSFTLKYAIRLWAHGSSMIEFHKNCKNFMKIEEDYVNSLKTVSFKINVETFNKKFTLKEKVDKIETLEYVAFEGPVELNNPEKEFYYFEYFKEKAINGMDASLMIPSEILFGEFISFGRRDLISELSLKDRFFIGNTSMEPQLALLMVNQGLVKPGDLVYDPFVGTGSIILSAAKLGALVLGSDIDYMTLHGKSKPSRKYCKKREEGECIPGNFRQYKCEQKYIDAVITDFSQPLWRDNFEFDAIITDPPYGIREAHERIDRKDSKKCMAMGEDSHHYPSTSKYELTNLYLDLLNFGVKHLKLGGRLVFWMPGYQGESDKCIPEHKSLRLISSSEQNLSKNLCRILITHEKVGTEFDDCDSFKGMLENLRQKCFTPNN